MRQMYHGWLIELVEETTGYSFQCWDLSQNLVLSDQKIYSTLKEAQNAAKYRADLEAVSLALIRFLNEIYGRCYYLRAEDHTALTNSIAEYVQLGNK